MTTPRGAAAAIALVSLALGFFSPSAEASDLVCANPVEPEEIAVCNDPYLLAMDMEMTVLLQNLADMEGGEVPEGVQMEYAHGMIARSECGDHFRCLEDVMRGQLETLNTTVLEWQDTPLVDGLGVAFVHLDGEAAVGGDIIPSKDPANFGWSKQQCQLRCAITNGCVAAHYDAIGRKGKLGYCTMKNAINLPLIPYEGVMIVRRSAMNF